MKPPTPITLVVVSASDLRQLTSREQAVADFFRRSHVADACMVLVAAMLAVLACGLGQAYCHQPSGPPESSEGLSYCAKMAHGYGWIAYVTAAVAVAVAVRWIWRGRRYARRLALVIVLVAGISATAWVSSLPTVVG